MDPAGYDEIFKLPAGTLQAAWHAVLSRMRERGYLEPEGVEAAFAEAAFGVGYDIGFVLCLRLCLPADSRLGPHQLADYAIDRVIDRPVRIERLAGKMARFSIDHGLPEGTSLAQMSAHPDWDWSEASPLRLSSGK